MAGPVVYEVRLIDAFGPAAQAIVRWAKAAQQSVHGMGGAVNQTEKAVAHAATALKAAEGSMRGNATAAASARAGYASLATEADRLASAQHRLAAATRVAAKENGWTKNGFVRNADGLWQRQQPAGGSSPAVVGGGSSKLWGALTGAWIGHMAVSGADHLVQKAADVDTMRQKLMFALGGDTEMVERAYQKSFALSGQYKNTTVGENLKIIDDLRANLPESMGHIIDDAAEPFVKMHSFFKAYEGGKHAGTAEKSLNQISAAIRAGELTGSMSGKLLADHVQALSMAQIWFGHKFKVQEYFQATRLAATALSAADKTFQYVDFPVLVQRLGTQGATSLATSFQKLIGGTRITQGTAEQWRALGLTDEKVLKNEVGFDKKGFVQTKFLPGKKWLKDSDLYATNLTEALMTHVLPALAGRRGRDGQLLVPGLSGNIGAMFKAGDIDGVTHALEHLRKTEGGMAGLTRQLTALGYDRNATKVWEELSLSLASILRDRQGILNAKKETEQYKSYDKSKQTLGASADRMWQALTGKDFVPWVSSNLDAVSDKFDRLAKILNDNPGLRDGIKWGAMAAGALAVAAAFGAVGMAFRLIWGLSGMGALTGLAAGIGGLAARSVGLASVAASASLLARSLRLIMGFTGIGAALLIGHEIYQNWDTLAGYIQKVWEMLKRITDLPGWITGALFGTAAHAGDKGVSALPQTHRQSEIASMEALRHLSVKVEPIQVEVKGGTLEVRYIGSVTGPSSAPLGGTASRGEALGELGVP